MEEIEQFLTISEELYSHLIAMPKEEERTEFTQQINILLDNRDAAIQSLEKIDISTSSLYSQLIELDSSIKKELEKIMHLIKEDIKDLQQKKRHEGSYSNPYAATQTLDGMYFDNKK